MLLCFCTPFINIFHGTWQESYERVQITHFDRLNGVCGVRTLGLLATTLYETATKWKEDQLTQKLTTFEYIVVARAFGISSCFALL